MFALRRKDRFIQSFDWISAICRKSYSIVITSDWINWTKLLFARSVDYRHCSIETKVKQIVYSLRGNVSFELSQLKWKCANLFKQSNDVQTGRPFLSVRWKNGEWSAIVIARIKWDPFRKHLFFFCFNQSPVVRHWCNKYSNGIGVKINLSVDTLQLLCLYFCCVFFSHCCFTSLSFEI